jgi:hypothetical protein
MLRTLAASVIEDSLFPKTVFTVLRFAVYRKSAGKCWNLLEFIGMTFDGKICVIPPGKTLYPPMSGHIFLNRRSQIRVLPRVFFCGTLTSSFS